MFILSDPVLNVDASNVSLESLKRRRDACSPEQSTGEESINTIKENAQSKLNGSTPEFKNSADGSHVSKKPRKCSIKTNCRGLGNKSVKPSPYVTGKGTLLQHVKRRLVQKAIVARTTSARKRFNSKSKPKIKTAKSQHLLTENILPEKGDLHTNESNLVPSQTRTNNLKTNVSCPTTETDDPTISKGTQNEQEGPTCNEVEFEKASVHSISSEDIAIDWQPAAADLVSIDSNDSDATVSRTQVAEGNEHNDSSLIDTPTCSKSQSNVDVSVSNSNPYSNNSKIKDIPSGEITKSNDNNEQQGKIVGETSRQETPLSVSGDAEESVDSNYGNSDPDYLAVIKDLELLNELQSQKLFDDSQCVNTGENSSEPGSRTDIFPVNGDSCGQDESELKFDNEADTTTAESQDSKISSSTTEKREESVTTNTQERVLDTTSSNSPNLFTAQNSVQSQIDKRSDADNHANEERPVDSQKSKCNNTETHLFDEDNEPQPFDIEGEGDDILLDEAVADEADYISVTDSIDDDIFIDEHVSFLS